MHRRSRGLLEYFYLYHLTALREAVEVPPFNCFPPLLCAFSVLRAQTQKLSLFLSRYLTNRHELNLGDAA
jgi:hypothetical protein